MTDKVVSFKTGRKPVSLLPSTIVKTVITILGAFAKATDEIIYPKGASSSEKDLIFCEKIGTLAVDHVDLSADNLKATCDYLEASVKYFNDCRTAGDDAVERAGELVPRDLTNVEMGVFESMDTMNAEELGAMKLVIDLLTAKWRASMESNDEVHPEHSSNETMLMIVKHITKSSGTLKPKGKFLSRKRPAPVKSARYTMGASFDSQQPNDDDETINTELTLNY